MPWSAHGYGLRTRTHSTLPTAKARLLNVMTMHGIAELSRDPCGDKKARESSVPVPLHAPYRTTVCSRSR